MHFFLLFYEKEETKLPSAGVSYFHVLHIMSHSQHILNNYEAALS